MSSLRSHDGVLLDLWAPRLQHLQIGSSALVGRERGRASCLRSWHSMQTISISILSFGLVTNLTNLTNSMLIAISSTGIAAELWEELKHDNMWKERGVKLSMSRFQSIVHWAIQDCFATSFNDRSAS